MTMIRNIRTPFPILGNINAVISPSAALCGLHHGGLCVAASLVWLRAVEGVRPDRWDPAGALICVRGTLLVILFGRR